MKHNKGRIATIIGFGLIALVGLVDLISLLPTIYERIGLVIIVGGIISISHLIRDEYTETHKEQEVTP